MKIKGNRDYKLLYERFLHLAQKILCDADSAKIVAEKALEKIKTDCSLDEPKETFINWSQRLLDESVEKYFDDLIGSFRNNCREAEKKLFKILNKRFSYLIQHKVYMDKNYINSDDGQDVVQNALKIVFEKCKTSKPKGTFIQWAQTILNNKYRELRRSRRKSSYRIRSLSNEDYEPVYTKRISDVMSTRSSTKEIRPGQVEQMDKEISEGRDQNVFNDDPYRWQPVQLSECEDLKKNLLKIIRNMGDRCKKVFEILFSKADVRSIHEAFPDLSRSRIDVMIFRCRKRLKEQALKRRVL